MKPLILVIEDEQRVAQALSQGLDESGYSVLTAGSGEEGLVLLLENPVNLLILDLNLPGRDGLRVLRTIRDQGMDMPVLILSARDSVQDRVLGLDSGADDYLVKPFAYAELLARIRTLLKRDHRSRNDELAVADLRIDTASRQVSRQGQTLALTSREFDILLLLAHHLGQPVSRQTIAREVWNVARATPLDNVIDVHMARIRKKIDGDATVKLIHTKRGQGFMLSEPPDDDQP